jgi:hypothetical protein
MNVEPSGRASGARDLLLSASAQAVSFAPVARRRCVVAALLGFLLLVSEAVGKVTITPINYRGWSDALALDNGKAVIVVVPSIGRVLQFGVKGHEGVFWENTKLYGKLADITLPVWASRDWVNFGGDKAWPSPEADWSARTGRKGWRPPPGFDGMPYSGEIKGNAVVLHSFVDPFYGLEVQRRVELHSSQAEMTITTTFKLVQGDAIQVGVWVVTQLRHPVGLFAPRPRSSFFPQGFVVLGQGLPPSLTISNRLLSLSRSTNQAHKIGLDGERLLWVGEKHSLLIESSRQSGAEYPDQGSNAEIYTNPDPLAYIELETLSPVVTLKPGHTLKHRNVYTLRPRRYPDAPAEVEARAILQ